MQEQVKVINDNYRKALFGLFMLSMMLGASVALLVFLRFA